MNIQILDCAEDDLVEGVHFYERSKPALARTSGPVSTRTLNLASLRPHPRMRRYHRLLSKRSVRRVFTRSPMTPFIHGGGLPADPA